jgi:hypothetical protein
MPRFRVEVRQTTQVVTYVEVEAETEGEAEELACEKASEEEDELEWDYITDSGFEAYEVEEIEDV